MSHVIKYLPTRLSAAAIIEVLHKLNISVPLTVEAAATSRDGMAAQIKAAHFSIGTNELDAALSKTELSISEKLRFKFALECVGLF
jgi:hypothetical protein